jgi:hypothetical protein
MLHRKSKQTYLVGTPEFVHLVAKRMPPFYDSLESVLLWRHQKLRHWIYFFCEAPKAFWIESNRAR